MIWSLQEKWNKLEKKAVTALLVVVAFMIGFIIPNQIL